MRREVLRRPEDWIEGKDGTVENEGEVEIAEGAGERGG